MINARRLALLRPDAMLINTARGAVIDEAALVEVLKAGKIRAAGLDVFADEPIDGSSSSGGVGERDADAPRRLHDRRGLLPPAEEWRWS